MKALRAAWGFFSCFRARPPGALPPDPRSILAKRSGAGCGRDHGGGARFQDTIK